MMENENRSMTGEVICRFCPHIGKNVILLRTFTDGPDRFSCLQASLCEMRKRVRCIDRIHRDNE